MPDIELEEILSSETIYHGSLVDLRKDTVRLPNGKTTDREVIVHPEVVAMIPVLDDGRVVMVRQYREAVRQILLEVPAGGIDPDETPEDAVRREMIEETGYRVGSMERLASFYSSPGFTTELMHLYLCRDLESGTPTEANDQIEVELMALDEATRQIRAGGPADAKTLLALTLYRLQQA